MNNAQLESIASSMIKDPRFLVLLAWVAFWKGLALWHAAGRNQAWWFIVLLAMNTLGVLEIIYLFMFLKLTFSTLFTKHQLATDA